MSLKKQQGSLDLFLEKLGEQEHFIEHMPKRIVWLSGAPGAGKGTNENYIIEYFNLYERPLVASSLLKSKEMLEKINQGVLLDDLTVVSSVFNGLLDEDYREGVLVDGFPRTLGQAKSVVWLHDFLSKRVGGVHFSSVILMLDEEESVRRQVSRGLRAMQYNERIRRSGEGILKEVRSTDLNPTIARHRYSLFMKETYAALQYLKDFLPSSEVACDGSLELVKSKVMAGIEGLMG